MEIYEVVIQRLKVSKKFEFTIIKNVAEPCSVCGVLACGKLDMLWYEEKGKKITLAFDGEYLDILIEQYLEENPEGLDYRNQPAFVREGNECRGWGDDDVAFENEGYLINIEDLLQTLSLLEKCSFKKEAESTLSSIKEHVMKALSLEKEIKILRG